MDFTNASNESVNRYPNLTDARIVVWDVDGTMIDTSTTSGEVDGNDMIIATAIQRTLGEIALKNWNARLSNSLDNSASSFEIVELVLPGLDRDVKRELTRKFVHQQVELILPQIGRKLDDGTPFPRLIPGFRNFWDTVSNARNEGQQLYTGVLSHNYERLIFKLFDYIGIDRPDVMIAHEQIADTHYFDEQPELLGKGRGVQLNRLLGDWALKFSVNVFDRARPHPNQVVFVGDSEYDQKEAAALGVTQFVRITEEHPEADWNAASNCSILQRKHVQSCHYRLL